MKKAIFYALVLSLTFGCSCDTYEHYTYSPPEHINDGFDVGSLDEVGIDRTPVEEAVNCIRRGRYKEVHSMLVYREGKLVLEEYFEGHDHEYEGAGHHGELVMWDRKMLHNVMSVTKSITSACIGIAIDNGFIESVRQPIFDYLPDYQRFKTEGKDKITIEHLLTMTSGLEWNEWALPYSNPENDAIAIYFAEDPVAFVLSKDLIGEPGKTFRYAGGNNILLGEILRNATKMNIDEFSGQYLFGPLGIEPYYWTQIGSGVIESAGSLRITPRDMAKIGVTFLNGGEWNGRRIISERWVERSATTYPGNYWLNDWDDFWSLKGYSYSWWLDYFVKSSRMMYMYYAGGWGGQYIVVIPELSTVVVFTGGNYTTYRPSLEILHRYILPAIH